MYTVEQKVGRLVEIRIVGQCGVQEFARLRSDLARIMANHVGTLVLVADLRGCEPFPEEAVPMVVGMMKMDNARLERNAHLHRRGSALTKQMGILVEMVNHPTRRIFFDTVNAATWLGEVLTPEEKATLQTLLADERKQLEAR